MGDYCTTERFEIVPGVWTHDKTVQELKAEGSCCQMYVCALPCPADVNHDRVGIEFGLPIVLTALSFALLGVYIGYRTVKGKAHNYFVCARTLPLPVVCFTLLGQGLDSNATLGNNSLAFKYGFWDGAVLPLGLGISLILNGLTLSGKIQQMGLLTLPDLFKRKYGKLMEVLVSFIELVSFTFLLAGNLVGISLLLQFCFGLPKAAGVVLAGSLLAGYVSVGGLFSLAYVDIVQVSFGFTGLLVAVIYGYVNESGPNAATPSLGFSLDLGGGISASTPGYAGTPGTCTDPITGAATCDNYAYPIGDKVVYPKSMEDADAYAPFPNAILLNWATIFVLGLGNLCALDFQARSMASKTPTTARVGNIVAGVALIAIAVPFGLLASLGRKHFGPDSVYAEFTADTCSLPLGLPSCAEWQPNEKFALFNLLWTKFPRVLGAWALIAILCASMSTADGAILATSTVAAHNLWRKIPKLGTEDKNLLLVARLFIIPMTGAAMLAASLAYDPAYLLVVAFDVVFASVFVPLMAAVYWPSHLSPNAGLLSLIAGVICRVILEFSLPKDGSLVAFGKYALNYGKAFAGLPSFMVISPPEEQNNMGVWDAAANPEQCEQTKMSDWTGLDSLVSPCVSLLVLVLVWAFERQFPNIDLLPFVSKDWRATEPLYQLRDEDDTSSPSDSVELGKTAAKDALPLAMPPHAHSGAPMEDSAHPAPRPASRPTTAASAGDTSGRDGGSRTGIVSQSGVRPVSASGAPAAAASGLDDSAHPAPSRPGSPVVPVVAGDGDRL